MKEILYFNNKIEMRKSPIHGWGIFAKDFITIGEILEEEPYLIIPMSPNESSSLFIDYRYNFPRENSKHQVIAFGFSCIYNHSNDPNAKWETDEENNIFIFSTIKDIQKDEEIFIYYGGDNYWADGRNKIQIK